MTKNMTLPELGSRNFSLAAEKSVDHNNRLVFPKLRKEAALEQKGTRPKAGWDNFPSGCKHPHCVHLPWWALLPHDTPRPSLCLMAQPKPSYPGQLHSEHQNSFCFLRACLDLDSRVPVVTTDRSLSTLRFQV